MKHNVLSSKADLQFMLVPPIKYYILSIYWQFSWNQNWKFPFQVKIYLSKNNDSNSAPLAALVPSLMKESAGPKPH